MRTKTLLISAVAASLTMACATHEARPQPVRKNGDTPRPKLIGRAVKHEPPRLDSSAPERTASDLIAWASASTVGERESVRKAISEIGRSEAVVRALCDQAFASRTKDHSRTLIALALIGETRSETAERCLTEFVRLPFPMTGHEVHGEIIEQTALGTLQAKAVDGLAYRMTASADAEVLRLAREHPSRIVRAEAISAYLWNRGDSAEAKAALAGVVRPDEKIFLDRVRRVSGDTAASFNAKLRAFLRQHPELQPPQPERSTDTGGAKIATDCDLRPPEQKAPLAGRKGN
jgi:hypothetical protein